MYEYHKYNTLWYDTTAVYRKQLLVVVLTLTHRHNEVRGHRTGSNNSGAEDYLRRKINKNRR